MGAWPAWVKRSRFLRRLLAALGPMSDEWLAGQARRDW